MSVVGRHIWHIQSAEVLRTKKFILYTLNYNLIVHQRFNFRQSPVYSKIHVETQHRVSLLFI